MKKLENIVFISLIFVAVVSRLVVHSYNFTAVLAVSFVFSFLFTDSKLKIFILPALAMFISDALIGFHAGILFVYSGFMLALVPSVFGLAFFKNTKLSTLVKMLSVVSGSLIFFLISNFGVWLQGDLYPMTIRGLQNCFVLGLPFYKSQLTADLVLTPILYMVCSKACELAKAKFDLSSPAKI